MDKINAALAEIDALNARVTALYRSLIDKTGAKCISATANSGVSTFGSVTFKGDAAIIVAFDGGSRTLYFDGEAVASGMSPLLAAVRFPNERTGELRLDGEAGARALVFGGIQ